MTKVLTNESQTKLDVIELIWPSPGLSLVYETWAFVCVAVLFTVIIVWTIIGNGLVFAALICFSRLRSLSNFLIGSLALSDFLLAITILPLSAVTDLTGHWLFGRQLCNIWLSLDVLYCTASVWNLVVIAFDRFTATIYPVWYRGQRTPQRVIAYAVFAWVFSIIICLPGLFGWGSKTADFLKTNSTWQNLTLINSLSITGNQNLQNKAATKTHIFDLATQRYFCELYTEPEYVVYSALGSFIIPLIIMICLYAKIFSLLRQRSDALRKKKKSTMSALINTQTITISDSSNNSKKVPIGKASNCKISQNRKKKSFSTIVQDNLCQVKNCSIQANSCQQFEQKSWPRQTSHVASKFNSALDLSVNENQMTTLKQNQHNLSNVSISSFFTKTQESFVDCQCSQYGSISKRPFINSSDSNHQTWSDANRRNDKYASTTSNGQNKSVTACQTKIDNCIDTSCCLISQSVPSPRIDETDNNSNININCQLLSCCQNSSSSSGTLLCENTTSKINNSNQLQETKETFKQDKYREKKRKKVKVKRLVVPINSVEVSKLSEDSLTSFVLSSTQNNCIDAPTIEDYCKYAKEKTHEKCLTRLGCYASEDDKHSTTKQLNSQPWKKNTNYTSDTGGFISSGSSEFEYNKDSTSRHMYSQPWIKKINCNSDIRGLVSSCSSKSKHDKHNTTKQLYYQLWKEKNNCISDTRGLVSSSMSELEHTKDNTTKQLYTQPWKENTNSKSDTGRLVSSGSCEFEHAKDSTIIHMYSQPWNKKTNCKFDSKNLQSPNKCKSGTRDLVSSSSCEFEHAKENTNSRSNTGNLISSYSSESKHNNLSVTKQLYSQPSKNKLNSKKINKSKDSLLVANVKQLDRTVNLNINIKSKLVRRWTLAQQLTTNPQIDRQLICHNNSIDVFKKLKKIAQYLECFQLYKPILDCSHDSSTIISKINTIDKRISYLIEELCLTKDHYNNQISPNRFNTTVQGHDSIICPATPILQAILPPSPVLLQNCPTVSRTCNQTNKPFKNLNNCACHSCQCEKTDWIVDVSKQTSKNCINAEIIPSCKQNGYLFKTNKINSEINKFNKIHAPNKNIKNVLNPAYKKLITTSHNHLSTTKSPFSVKKQNSINSCIYSTKENNHLEYENNCSKYTNTNDVMPVQINSVRPQQQLDKNNIQLYQQQSQKLTDNRERRATKHMALIMLVFVLCCIPFTVMYLVRGLCDNMVCQDMPHLRVFVTWLGYANSGLNPIFYAIFNEEFRTAFAVLLGCKKAKHSRLRNSI